MYACTQLACGAEPACRFYGPRSVLWIPWLKAAAGPDRPPPPPQFPLPLRSGPRDSPADAGNASLELVGPNTFACSQPSSGAAPGGSGQDAGKGLQRPARPVAGEQARDKRHGATVGLCLHSLIAGQPVMGQSGPSHCSLQVTAGVCQAGPGRASALPSLQRWQPPQDWQH